MNLRTLSLTLCLGLAAASPAGAQDAPAPTFTMESNRLVLPGPITFETGTAKLTPESAQALAHVEAWLKAKEAITLARVEGHTAGGGDAAADVALSLARAEAVTQALVSRGVPCARLLPVGYGAFKPVAASDTPEGRAQNTRIEVQAATLLGRAIGGMPVDGSAPAVGHACPAAAPQP